MHTLSLSAACCLTLCLASAAMGQYAKSSPYQQQRKMTPVPNTYSSPAASTSQEYGQHEEQQQQQQQQQQPEPYSQQSKYDERQQPKYDERQQAASYGAPVKSSGYGQQQQQQKYEEPHYPPMPFAWGYDINDGYGGAQYHKENGDEYGKRTGSYGYTDAYGVYRQVDYVADEYGFRATIKTNEPGTANESPADVELHAYEPPSNYYAGNTQSYGSASASSYQPAKPTGGYSAPKSATSQYPNAHYAAAAPSKIAPSAYGRQSQNSHDSGYPQQAAPATSSYQQRSGYGMMSASAPTGGYQQQQQQQQQQQEYSGSVPVPVYQKAAVVAPKKQRLI